MDLSGFAERGAPSPWVERDTVADFLQALFGTAEIGDGESIALRGLGEKGATAEGTFREQAWVPLEPSASVLDQVCSAATRWNTHGHGAFLVPAIMAADSMASHRQIDANVRAFTAILVDLDTPDTAEDSLARLDFAIGPASMVVESSPGKLHAYWLLNEPCEDVERVARVRKLLALKVGADTSFGRVVQVIRIPGTRHGKHGSDWRATMREFRPDNRFDLDTLEDQIESLSPFPWSKAAMPSGLDLLAAASRASLGALRTEVIPEGGGGLATRYEAFSRVAGAEVSNFRRGEWPTLDDARSFVMGWAEGHLTPAWPAERLGREWDAIVDLDVRARGPLPVGHATRLPHVQLPAQEGAEGIKAFALHRWTLTEKPARRWLIKGLIRAGAAHVLASEGGVGKTFALLDLAMKVAEGRQGETWLGQGVDPEHTGGTAVILTVEDDADELHIRIADMDPAGKRLALGDRCIVVPMASMGGAFTLVENRGGNAVASPEWSKLVTELAAILDLQLVAVDTLAATLHGEENSSVVVSQYMAALGLLQVERNRAKLPPVATVLTHHVRKQGARDTPIQNAADMRNAIRGSNALMGSVRMAIGIWQPPDWKDKLARLERPAKPGTLFTMAVVKANNPEAMTGERVLVRAAAGGLEDVTDRMPKGDPKLPETMAWLVATVAWAAAQGFPYKRTGAPSPYERKHELPSAIHALGRDKLLALVDKALGQGVLVSADGWLDVPGGKVATEGHTTKAKGVGAMKTCPWSEWSYHSLFGRVLLSGTVPE
jgi:hypothetical protein